MLRCRVSFIELTTFGWARVKVNLTIIIIQILKLVGIIYVKDHELSSDIITRWWAFEFVMKQACYWTTIVHLEKRLTLRYGNDFFSQHMTYVWLIHTTEVILIPYGISLFNSKPKEELATQRKEKISWKQERNQCCWEEGVEGVWQRLNHPSCSNNPIVIWSTTIKLASITDEGQNYSFLIIEC